MTNALHALVLGLLLALSLAAVGCEDDVTDLDHLDGGTGSGTDAG